MSSILLVDDEPSNLLALEAILDPLGQELVRAASGREALRQALKRDFAVILLDVQMPGMDGFETAELLRKRARTRDVPIIFLTAISKDEKFVSRGYDVGAVDYLFKPYEPDLLRSKVSVFVELARKNAVIRAQHDKLRQVTTQKLAELRESSEQRYADLADSIPQIVWTADAEGTVEYVNRRWRDVSGSDGVDFADIVHPDDLRAFLAGWRGAVDSGEPWEAELRLGSARAGYRFHLVRAVPRRDAEGQVQSWIGTGADIDARVRAHMALGLLADASRRLGAAFDDPSELEGVLQVALPILGDAAALDLLDDGGTSRCRRIVATSGRATRSVLEDPRLSSAAAAVRQGGIAQVHLDVASDLAQANGKGGRDAGALRPLHDLGIGGYMCLPLESRGRMIGSLSLLRIGERRGFEASERTIAEDLARRIAVAIDNARLHATTEQRRALLEQANRSKDVFLATLSHELRTPLNAIVGWTDILGTGSLGGEELSRAIGTIDRNAHALSSLVADLLDVSRIVTGALKLESKVVRLGAILEAAVEAARPQCASKPVLLDVQIERVGCVRGDSMRLRQVFGNLLSNAVKFTPEGGTITIRATRQGESGRVVVSDTGEGIPEELLPHVFERFQQAEGARAKGLGLGLAIVKHLVEEHGGTVSAASAGVGRGASFTVELPIVAEEVVPEPHESVRPSTSGGGPQPELANVHALVVEDDPDGNELITTILERYGARVTSVGTAAAALEALERERPDVLVSDIGLPDASGIELIRWVRDKSGPAMPAIALTAYASRQDAAKAIAAGFDAHVAKPVQPGTLGAVVAKLVSRRAAEISPPPGE